jgi:periplasmic protein TonB
MAPRFPFPYSFLATPARRWPRRFVLACCASVATHLWLVRELPLGAPRAGNPSTPLTVRLQPADEHAMAMTSVDEKRGGAHVASAMPVPSANGRKVKMPTPSRDGLRGDGDADPTGITPATDVTYYPARQLDVYPALLAPLSIAYPERASAEDRAGRALIMVLIDARGHVAEVTVMEADPPGYFEDAARKTLERAAFSPGRRNGIPVRSRVLIQLNFDPRTAAAGMQ